MLGKARDNIKVKLSDPAGYNDDVGAHVNTQEKMNKIIEQLHKGYAIAVEAEALGDAPAAFEKWRALFGDYFPAYG